MATLDQIIAASATDTPEVAQEDVSNPVVEPLDGIPTVDDLTDRFPETVYNKGRDTLLYTFLSAICGDSGAGMLKRQAYEARLRNEAEVLTFKEIDTFYVQTFRFKRLASELYPDGVDPDNPLTPDQVDAVKLADAQFKHRMMDFMNATRLGNTPDGMALAATSGSGIDCESIENYKAVYDGYSDAPLDLEFFGNTTSPNEFIINPRLDTTESAGDHYFTPEVWKVFTPGIVSQTPSVATRWDDPNSEPVMKPEIERNMVDILDRLRPVGALMTVKIAELIFTEISVDETLVHGSSERFFMSRFITGNGLVPWPDEDATTGAFITAAGEREAPALINAGREWPALFLTVDGVSGYTDKALDDLLYDTLDFYATDENGISAYTRYKSEHTGHFYDIIGSIYPFFKNAPDSFVFAVFNSLAPNNTRLVLEGR